MCVLLEQLLIQPPYVRPTRVFLSRPPYVRPTKVCLSPPPYVRPTKVCLSLPMCASYKSDWESSLLMCVLLE